MATNVFWLIALIAFCLVEAATVGLASLWFAVGALGALIVSGVGGGVWIQITVFLVLSFASLLLVRPLAQKFIIPRRHATNSDRIIGTRAVVTKEIDNLKGQGLVSVGGIIWTARAENNQIIAEGVTVRILRIEGVKVFVTPEAESSGEGKE